MSGRRLRRFSALILASLMLAQIGLLIHKADHTALAQESPCVLCASAHHLAGNPVTDSVTVAFLGPDRLIETALPDFSPAALVFAYQSRAPPQHS